MSIPMKGRIVWATGPDPRGENVKRRPWVAASDVLPDGTVLLVAVTTQLGMARSSVTVELPSDPAGHPVTKLARPSEVVCTWSMRLPVAEVAATGGVVPSELLAGIIARVEWEL